MRVEQQGFVVALVESFHVGQNRVGVIAHRLGVNHRDVDMVACEAGGLDADAALHAVFAQVGAPGPGGDHQVNLVALGADAQLFRADPGERADVAAFEFVLAHHGALRVHHFLLREGNLHAQNLGAVEQALGVLFQAEDRRALRRLVSAHAFKGAAAVVQGVGQHVDLGVTPFDHLAVHPDFAVAVFHGGGYCGHGLILMVSVEVMN